MTKTTPILAAVSRLAMIALPAIAAHPAIAGPAPSPEARATAIVAKMTLEEKASQLINSAPAVPRVGLPDYQWWSEALHGYAFDPYATNYPEPIGLAATFDAPLLKRIAGSISAEGLEKSNAMVAGGNALALGAGRSYWSPNLNIFRDPRWGRGQETYGEDPYLTARMGVAYIEGLQGPDRAHPAILATPKHFAVHSGPEPTRHIADVNVSLHDMRDTYLPAFRAAVVEGHAGSIMCAYSAINGQPACANTFLMHDTLRGAWGFKGVVVSDCGAVNDIAKPHKFAPDEVTGSALAIRAGMDIECASESLFDRDSFGQSRNYVDAVKSGKLTMAELDRAVTRSLVGRIRTGAMDFGLAPAARPVAQAGPDRGALALDAADKSMVLLKNDGVLPLRAQGLRIAVIGPLADSRRVMRGNYTNRETSQLPSVYDGIRRALPDAMVTLVPAGPSFTDGEVVPTSALQSEDGNPGVTVRFYPFVKTGKAAPKSLMEKFMSAMSAKPVDQPVATRVEPLVNFELFSQPLLPDGGKAVASGFLVAPVSGTYRVGARSMIGTLQIGDKPPLTIRNGFNPGVAPVFEPVELEAGKRYPFTYSMLVPILHFAELDWQRISPKPEADVADAARDADVVVAVVGLNSTLESEESAVDLPGFKGGDRQSLDLPADQMKLLEAAQATGKPIVVVNLSGSAINLDWMKRKANAIVQAWYPGEAGGLAVGRVIAGAVNPAGRLPLTFYRDLAQLPPFEEYAMKGRTYRYFTGEPIYKFGYGLSYTRFAYSPVKVTPHGKAGGMLVESSVSNVGARAGDEVAQLYLGFPDAPGVPRVALRGFERLSLAPGENRPVRFELSPRDLSSVSPEGKTRILAGNYRVFVGGGQPGGELPGSSGSFKIGATTPLPD